MQVCAWGKHSLRKPYMVNKVSMHVFVYILGVNMKYINQCSVKCILLASSLIWWCLETFCCCSSLGEGFGHPHQLLADRLPHWKTGLPERKGGRQEMPEALHCGQFILWCEVHPVRISHPSVYSFTLIAHQFSGLLVIYDYISLFLFPHSLQWLNPLQIPFKFLSLLS